MINSFFKKERSHFKLVLEVRTMSIDPPFPILPENVTATVSFTTVDSTTLQIVSGTPYADDTSYLKHFK